jgi:hypothetical protein
VAPAEQRGEPGGETQGGDSFGDPQEHGPVIGAAGRVPEDSNLKLTLT